MHELAISDRFASELPYAVRMHLHELPAEGQQEFAREYQRRKKDTGIAYLLQLLFSAPYAYLDEWGKQILYWLTFGGFGIWWLINWIRIPNKVRSFNNQLADSVIRNISTKYLGYGRKGKKAALRAAAPPTPRDLRISYDPSDLNVENLQIGYMLDYDLKTWRVVTALQFDWEDGQSEQAFIIVSDLERRNLFVRREGGHLEVMETRDVSIHAIDSFLEKELIALGRPLNSVVYGGETYYRENGKTGWCFLREREGAARKVTVWEYLNARRDLFIRIEVAGKQQIRASVGEPVLAVKFSDILPNE